MLARADHFAEHLDDIPVHVVVCAELDGLHPTDVDTGRLSIVGGGSVYPVVQNFLLGCRNEGLGAALTTLLCYFEKEVKELLGIPDGVITAAMIPVGWPAEGFPKKLLRRPVSEIAFSESYQATCSCKRRQLPATRCPIAGRPASACSGVNSQNAA